VAVTLKAASFTVAVLWMLAVALSVSLTVTLRTKDPSSAYAWVPVTVKMPPVTDGVTPVVVVPSP
jgi:hypothetical protein